MGQNNTSNTPKSSLTIRIVVGSYLIYIVFMLIKGYGDLGDKDKLFNMIFIGLFAVIGVLLLFTSIRTWMRIEKEEKEEAGEIEDEKQEIVEDSDESVQDKDSDESQK